MTRGLMVSVAAVLLGVAVGRLLGLAAGQLIGLLSGYGGIFVATVATAIVMAILEWLRPRSGIPAGVAGVATLAAAGPLGLYYVLPAILIVTPVAVYRAVRAKRTE